MGNWIVHATVGGILAFLCILWNTGLDQRDLSAAVIATILGALIPDIDHKKSKIRNLFRWLTFIVLLSIFYIVISSIFSLYPDIRFLYSQEIVVLFVVFGLVVFLASIVTSFIESFIPRHRGPIHRIFASFLFSVLVFIFSLFLGFSHSLLIALWGFLGYLSHLFVDFLA
ncbi:MAG: metal-dependent hydrolase [Candidatus Micrarchaeota archaeon]|nr:metal-dependent hydrolase [Candidatus Micrarchaeota archaeon]